MADNQKPGALYQSVMLMFGMVMNVHLGRANRDCPNSMAGIGALLPPAALHLRIS